MFTGIRQCILLIYNIYEIFVVLYIYRSLFPLIRHAINLSKTGKKKKFLYEKHLNKTSSS